MEINSTVKKSEDEGFLEMPVEGLDAQLDDILDEVVDLAQDMRAEELIQGDLAPGGEETGEEANDETQAIDDLELEIELPQESTELQAGIEHEAEEAESTLDALIDAENEIMSTLLKESVASDTRGTTETATSKDAEDRGTEKARSGLCSKIGEDASEPMEKTVMPEEAADGPPAPDDQLSKDASIDYELVNEAEEKGGEDEKTNSDALANELGALLDKKMEVIVTRLVEERMPAIVEPIILEKIKKLLLSLE